MLKTRQYICQWSYLMLFLTPLHMFVLVLSLNVLHFDEFFKKRLIVHHFAFEVNVS